VPCHVFGDRGLTTSMPSLRSSPWTLGAPHSGLDQLANFEWHLRSAAAMSRPPSPERTKTSTMQSNNSLRRHAQPIDGDGQGGPIVIRGGDNGDRLRGLGLDGVVLDESADIPPSLFPQVVRPALADRGGFAVIIICLGAEDFRTRMAPSSAVDAEVRDWICVPTGLPKCSPSKRRLQPSPRYREARRLY
jgi:hypothetical protein